MFTASSAFDTLTGLNLHCQLTGLLCPSRTAIIKSWVIKNVSLTTEICDVISSWLGVCDKNAVAINASSLKSELIAINVSNSVLSLDTSKAKQSKTDEFDSLFDEKKDSKEVDDLPF